MSWFSSVALVDPRGWLLMQERDEHPEIDPECWGFPGGGIEDGETPEQAAYRELAEETGIELAGGLEFVGEYPISVDEPEHRFSLFAGSTRLTDDDVECHEGRQMVFVEPSVLLTRDLTTSAASVLPGFLASDRYARLRASATG